MKKLTAILLVFAMLVPLSTAVAADEVTAQPTVEEILNEYHQKAFEREMCGEVQTASTWSRRGTDARTLEQETVDALNEAGYEAYHVTAENYDTLQTELYTDFGEMGLDPDGSYIITISGEDQPADDHGSTYSRISPEMNFEGPPDHTGSAIFRYTYNGNTYYMRYVTVSGEPLIDSGFHAVQSVERLEYMLNNLFTTTLIAVADNSSKKVPLGTIVSLLTDTPEEYVYIEVEAESFAIHARSDWICEYIQVWDSENNKWVTSQLSEYVYSSAYCAGHATDPKTGLGIPKVTEECTGTIYSYWYHDREKRKEDAMEAYDHYTIYFDCVNSVEFCMGDEEGEILFNSQNDPLFTHYRGTAVILPD